MLNKVILLAEDDLLLRGIMKELLENDYIVEVANDAKETLEKLRQLKKLDLIVLDIMMPLAGAFDDSEGGMNAGIRILEFIRAESSPERLRKLPVLCYTVRASENKIRTRLEELGVSSIIAKGDQTPEEIIAEIKKLTKDID